MMNFRKLVKKFKKINIYIRIIIVYCIFLFIKWSMYEITGIEIGKEGMTSEQSRLAGEIQSNVQKLAGACSKAQISEITREQRKLKELIKKQYNMNKNNVNKVKCPKCPTCPKPPPCKKFTAILKEVVN